VLSLALALLAATAAPLPAAKPGQCGWVHGRFSVYNGSGIQRIWIIGTHRMIAMRDDDDRAPPEIARYERSGAYLKGDLFGDYRICAREPRRAGHMQHVYVTATRNIRFRTRPS
jgi:hypothetical protein